MATSPETEHPVKAFGWAVKDSSGTFSPFEFSRRATGDHDVQFQILYCGICHSDLHMVQNDFGFTIYPLVPGHEIVGVVTEVGTKVKKFKLGDKVGVGCIIGSCRQCDLCNRNLENYCDKLVLTYMPYPDNTLKYGGYSDIMVADEHFVIRWPENFPMDIGAPLLGAGITTYSPLRHFGLDKPGTHVGVVGLGGLGHIAVKFAKAFGCKVTAISTSAHKKDEAVGKFGVDGFLVSLHQDQMEAAANTFDGILDTVSGDHSVLPLINLLKPEGKLILVGSPDSLQVPVFPLLAGRKAIVGSQIGGLKETQEMIDFAAKHNVLPEVEIIPIDYVNTAMQRLAKSDVKYRFVIDIGNSLKRE